MIDILEIKVDRSGNKGTTTIKATGNVRDNLTDLVYAGMELIENMAKNVSKKAPISEEKSKEIIFKMLFQIIKIAKKYDRKENIKNKE